MLINPLMQGKGGGGKVVTVWTNPNISSGICTLPAGKIALDLSDASLILISFTYSGGEKWGTGGSGYAATATGRMAIQPFIVGESNTMYVGEQQISSRPLTVESDGITFGQGHNTYAGYGDRYAVPSKIVKISGTTNGINTEQMFR